MSKGVRDHELSVLRWLIRGEHWTVSSVASFVIRHAVSVMYYPSRIIHHALSVMHSVLSMTNGHWPCIETFRSSSQLCKNWPAILIQDLCHTFNPRWACEAIPAHSQAHPANEVTRSAAKEAPVVVWGCVPQQGPGAEPRWGLGGAENIGKLIQL